jgi:hypothetical protein
LAGQSGPGAEGLRLAAQRGHRSRRRLRAARLPETSQIRDKGHRTLES